jgi:hypothetical protein
MTKREVQRYVVGYLSRRREAVQLVLDSASYRGRRYEDAVLEADEIDGLLSDLGARVSE